MRIRLNLLLLLLALSLPAVSLADQPNFVFILVDDLGKEDLGVEGTKFYETPHIDSLARRSMRFERGYSACQVCSPSRAAIQTGKKFAEAGLQIAAGVPLMCDEPEDFRTFRLGLFGLDKLANIDRTVASLEQAIDEVVVT